MTIITVVADNKQLMISEAQQAGWLYEQHDP